MFGAYLLYWMRDRRWSVCLMLCMRRYWRPDRRLHLVSCLVDSKISAICLFNSCSVISLPALYGPGDWVDPVPGTTLFRIVLSLGFLTAFVQWNQLSHSQSPLSLHLGVDCSRAHSRSPDSLYGPAATSYLATPPWRQGTASGPASALGRKSRDMENRSAHIPPGSGPVLGAWWILGQPDTHPYLRRRNKHSATMVGRWADSIVNVSIGASSITISLQMVKNTCHFRTYRVC